MYISTDKLLLNDVLHIIVLFFLEKEICQLRDQIERIIKEVLLINVLLAIYCCINKTSMHVRLIKRFLVTMYLHI